MGYEKYIWGSKSGWASSLTVGVVCAIALIQAAIGAEMSSTWKMPDEPLTHITRIAAGGTGHSLALTADGSIIAWGDNHFGQCNVPSPNKDFVAIAAGYTHSLGLKKDGSVAVWGGNYHNESDAPIPNGDFVAIAAGGYRSLEINKNGVVVQGQIPIFRIGQGLSEQNPMFIEPNTVFVAASASGGHVLGLTSKGSIAAWGSNGAGQRLVPSSNTGFIAVAAGGHHSLGLKGDGSIVAWGQHAYGQCDVPNPNKDFIAIAAGEAHSLGLKKDGSIVAWGAGQPGQKGGLHFGQSLLPSPNKGFTAIAAGCFNSLGLKDDGSVVIWGKAGSGQYSVPTRMPATAGELKSLTDHTRK